MRPVRNVVAKKCQELKVLFLLRHIQVQMEEDDDDHEKPLVLLQAPRIMGQVTQQCNCICHNSKIFSD